MESSEDEDECSVPLLSQHTNLYDQDIPLYSASKRRRGQGGFSGSESDSSSRSSGSRSPKMVTMLEKLNRLHVTRKKRKERELEAEAMFENPESVVDQKVSFFEEAVARSEAHRAYSMATRHVTLIPNSQKSSWAFACDELEEHLDQKEQETSKRLKLQSRVDYLTDPMYGTDTCSGDERLMQFNQTLDSFKWSRVSTQVLFHNLFTNAVLPLIYGPEWDANAERVMREHRIGSRLHTEVMVMTPRRYGKTVSVAMWVAGALLNIPGVKIGIFSTGYRASSSLMQMAAGFLTDIPGAERRIVKLTEKELFVAKDPLPDGVGRLGALAQAKKLLPSTSQLHSFPSSVTCE